jgi:hypothetical protein
MVDRFALEGKAYTSFAALMQSAQECRGLFEAARIQVPERLQRFLGESDAPEKAPLRVTVPPPEQPPMPPQWKPGWIWVPARDMTASHLVLAILRSATAPMTPTQIREAVLGYGVELSKGTLANIGTRFDGQLIARSGDGWILITRDLAPVLEDSVAWGDPSVFDKQEVAAHRRLGILHVLKAHGYGLQVVQLVRTLSECEWIKAPVTKDLVKVDLQELQKAGFVRRVGNSGKWEATEGAP